MKLLAIVPQYLPVLGGIEVLAALAGAIAGFLQDQPHLRLWARMPRYWPRTDSVWTRVRTAI